ncbi:hypothetical protein PSPO01_16081 [Paraphaeosphaeria sporulosa]
MDGCAGSELSTSPSRRLRSIKVELCSGRHRGRAEGHVIANNNNGG